MVEEHGSPCSPGAPSSLAHLGHPSFPKSGLGWQGSLLSQLNLRYSPGVTVTKPAPFTAYSNDLVPSVVTGRLCSGSPHPPQLCFLVHLLFNSYD